MNGQREGTAPLHPWVNGLAFDFWLLLIPLYMGSAYGFWISVTGKDPLHTYLFAGLPFVLFWIAEFILLTWLTYRRWNRSRRGWLVLGIVTLIFFSICLFAWPLRLGFWTSKESFHELLHRFEAGQRIDFPVRAGVFEIVDFDKRGDNIMLVLRGPQGDREGFVYTAAPTNDPGFNAWTEEQLDDHWWRVTED